ncbi:MAG TPA: glutathionylspermidine synthase family protein [Blastocatellia bacterium]|nr:glutathionylspermidine synthase family protein [Blastocatellia bacterium]
MKDRSLSYGEFARMLYGTGILSDPWLRGRERFQIQPSLLTGEQAEALQLTAERIGTIYHELTEIVRQRPELLERYFDLTPWQKAMWLASEGRWHGIARVDLFICADGRIRACEMNSDTPSGEAEAVLLNQLLHPYYPETVDPNTELEERFWRMLVASHRARLEAEDSLAAASNERPLDRVAIIYPTDLPEDLSMIAIYKRWLEARGVRVVLGSPYNLGVDGQGRVTVLGEPVDLIVRHYKTDWWSEREVIWANQAPYADPDPLDRELTLLLEAEHAAALTVVNPFGSVVPQNKKAMALMWERSELFSAQARSWIAEYLPETRRLTALDPDQLHREEWVLKSDYGCEGDSVVCGPFVKLSDWRLALAAAIPNHWVAQRFFEVAPTPEGLLPNYGVYLIGGRAAGFYTRLSPKATDYTAVTAPTFIAGS